MEHDAPDPGNDPWVWLCLWTTDATCHSSIQPVAVGARGGVRETGRMFVRRKGEGVFVCARIHASCLRRCIRPSRWLGLDPLSLFMVDAAWSLGPLSLGWLLRLNSRDVPRMHAAMDTCSG